MNLEALDDFSSDFAKHLFSVFPDWILLAKSERAEGALLDYLVVEVPPSPQADPASTLLIHTDNQEVTVGFDHFHTHFFAGENASYSEILKFIASILGDELASVSEWHGDKWYGSWTLERAEVDDLSTAGLGPGSRIRVRSWNGSLDRDLAGPPEATTKGP